MFKIKIIHFIFIAIASGISLDLLAVSDPMKPDTYSIIEKSNEEKKIKWVLSSILISSERRLANINGKSVSIGDNIDSAKVIDISVGKITLMQNGEKFKLYLTPKIEKVHADIWN